MQSTPFLSETITIGTPVVLACLSPSTHFAVVFEDDGESGAFHGLVRSREEQPGWAICSSTRWTTLRTATTTRKLRWMNRPGSCAVLEPTIRQLGVSGNLREGYT